MENLLQTVGRYRKKDPKTEDEAEFLENIFDVLSFSLFSNQANIAAFLAGQGVELCLRCINEKVHSGRGSLKVLSVLMKSGETAAEVSE